MKRQFTDKERNLTEKNLKSQNNKLKELTEQLDLNKIKENFIFQQREYQDKVNKIENKQSDEMFEKSIKMLKSQLKNASEDSLEIENQILYNTENHERLITNRKFTEKWTPYLRLRTDNQNKEINEELEKDIKITQQIIDIAEDQLENGVEIKTPTGVN